MTLGPQGLSYFPLLRSSPYLVMQVSLLLNGGTLVALFFCGSLLSSRDILVMYST